MAKTLKSKRPSILSLCIGGVFFFGFMLLPSSCGSDSNVANLLPPDVQYMADTMFSRRKRELIAEFDRKCQARTEELIQMKVDSLVTLEKARINAMIK